MFMHDHEKVPPGGRFCPILKDICREGWVPAMGENDKKERPVCIAWRPVTVMIGGPQGTPREIHDCSLGWLPDLLVQAANESYSAAAATESARNHIAGQAADFRRMANVIAAVARKNGVTSQEVAQIERERQIQEQLQLEASKTSKPN